MFRRSLKTVAPHRPLHPVASRRVLLIVIFSFVVFSTPSPIHAHVGIVLRLPGDRMAVTEQELFIGIVFEVVIAADVDHCRSPGLGGHETFAPMREEFGTHLQPRVVIAAPQRSSIWIISMD